MSPYNVPERPLDPPEDDRRAVYTCEICDEPIYEGDDYYDIPGLGYCCEECIKEAQRYHAEPDYPDREED